MSQSKTTKRTKFWKTDWFVGVLVVVVTLMIHSCSDFTLALENRYYNFASTSTSTARAPSDKVTLIKIDDASINALGRFPWSRDVMAKMIDDLAAAGAKVIAPVVLLPEPQVERSAPYFKRIQDIVSAPEQAANPTAAAVQQVIAEAAGVLDADAKLAGAIKKAPLVVLPTVFEMGVPTGKPDGAFQEWMARHTIEGKAVIDSGFTAVDRGKNPIKAFAEAAAAVGHLNQSSDASDAYVRRECLYVNSFGAFVPSMALMVVARSLNLSPADIKATPEQVRAGGITIPTDESGCVLTQFHALDVKSRPSAFNSVSFFDVYSGKVATSAFKDKIVVIGPTASGVGQLFPTPASASTFAPELLAQTTSSLLQGQFFKEPSWGVWLSLGLAVLVAVYLVAGLPRLRAGHAALITAAVFLGLLVAEFALIAGASTWIKLVLPALLLVIGHLALTTKRFLVTETGKEAADAESAETNRMMGLVLQGKGQLDEAYDRFRRVRLGGDNSDAVMDNLYHLALDFERKRQFNKAQAVYEYMSAHQKDYKDLPAKLNRAKNLSETVILGGGGAHPGGTIVLGDGSVEKPKLGRYDVEKELGKGAMGVVYLGKDPKIGRVVAIKTMALSQEFEGDELEDARQRFFREAETAGRLQHPHIVTIFDAGEEHDLAYIAMEFLKGKDLADCTKDGHLLPMPQVVSICARVAEALSFAHKQNVVHRDIKPANIMYDPASDTVKVTDFGIARITDSSKTKTGLVLGTPSFMSPEQIAGKKVDGRSDLYSLGVMLFQMLAGVLPFRGDSMAELMYKIANEEAPDIRIIRPEISPALAAVVALALAKRSEIRYQDGDQFAADLRAAAGLPPVASSGFGGSSFGAPPVASGFAAAAAPRSATSTVDATQVMHAAEKTVIAQALPTAVADNDKTVVMAPRATPPATATNRDADKTVVFTRDGAESSAGVPVAASRVAPPDDPFAKTIITPPRNPNGPGA